MYFWILGALRNWQEFYEDRWLFSMRLPRLFKQIMLYKSQMAVSSLSYFILPKPTNVCCECSFFYFFPPVLSHDHLDTLNGPDFTLNYVGAVSQLLPSQVVISHRWAGRIDTGGHFPEDFVFLLLKRGLSCLNFRLITQAPRRQEIVFPRGMEGAKE